MRNPRRCRGLDLHARMQFSLPSIGGTPTALEASGEQEPPSEDVIKFASVQYWKLISQLPGTWNRRGELPRNPRHGVLLLKLVHSPRN